MKVYRITSKKHAGDISGTGAAIYNGRWNKKGTPVLYTGESIDIALLETVVHAPPMLIPSLDLLILEIPDDSTEVIEVDDLPNNWKDYPAPSVLAEIGERWIIENSKLALKVPSSIIATSSNYILNPRHPEYHKVKIISREEFYFDPRLRR